MQDPAVYKNYFENYTSLVPEKDAVSALEKQIQALSEFFNSVSDEKAMYAYAEGKWMMKEMLQHMIDTERIFAYRALCISRKEEAILPGFDENVYATNSLANRRSWADLTHEMKAVRESTMLLFQSFTQEMLSSTGYFSVANGDVNTLGLIIAGHFYHHVNITNERYL